MSKGPVLDLSSTARRIKVPGLLNYPTMATNLPLAISEAAAQKAYASAPATTAEGLRDFRNMLAAGHMSRARYPAFYDELADYIAGDDHYDPAAVAAKCDLEWQVVRDIACDFAGFDHLESADFESLLTGIHRRLGQGRSSLRRRPVHVAGDDQGNRIELIDHRKIPSALADLHGYLSSNARSSYVLSAIAAYVGVIHAHPFEDGNGRTARVLFNIVLCHYGRSQHYLPITSLWHASAGSMLIKLRRTILLADWVPLHRLVTAGIQAAAERP